MGYAAGVSARILIPFLIAGSAAISGCGTEPGPTPGGEPSATQRAARIELIRTNSAMNDLELAHLCPAIYPADVLKDPKKYGFSNQKAKKSGTAASVALAAKAGCGKPVPVATGKQSPKPKQPGTQK